MLLQFGLDWEDHWDGVFFPHWGVWLPLSEGTSIWWPLGSVSCLPLSGWLILLPSLSSLTAGCSTQQAAAPKNAPTCQGNCSILWEHHGRACDLACVTGHAFHVKPQLLVGFCEKKLSSSSLSPEALTPCPPSEIFARPDLVCGRCIAHGGSSLHELQPVSCFLRYPWPTLGSCLWSSTRDKCPSVKRIDYSLCEHRWTLWFVERGFAKPTRHQCSVPWLWHTSQWHKTSNHQLLLQLFGHCSMIQLSLVLLYRTEEGFVSLWIAFYLECGTSAPVCWGGIGSPSFLQHCKSGYLYK